jgi:hypothetical protein
MMLDDKKPHFISEADGLDELFMGDEAVLKAIDPDGIVTVLREEHRVDEVIKAVSKFYSVEETAGAYVSASAYKIKGSDKVFFVWSVGDYGSCGDVDCFIASPMRGVRLLSEVWQWLVKTAYVDNPTMRPSDDEIDEIQNIEKRMADGEDTDPPVRLFSHEFED